MYIFNIIHCSLFTPTASGLLTNFPYHGGTAIPPIVGPFNPVLDTTPTAIVSNNSDNVTMPVRTTVEREREGGGFRLSCGGGVGGERGL